jgi:hypothetical protein
MRLVSWEVLRLLSRVPPSRSRKRACTKTAMGSAPRYQRHSWSDDPAELPTAVSELMQVCPAALSNAVKVSLSSHPLTTHLALGTPCHDFAGKAQAGA